MHRFATPDLTAVITCRCKVTVKVNKSGTVARHGACAFSGVRLKAAAIAARAVSA